MGYSDAHTQWCTRWLLLSVPWPGPVELRLPHAPAHLCKVALALAKKKEKKICWGVITIMVDLILSFSPLCVYVSKNDQALAKLEPLTAVSAYLGLISKVQSSAGA